MATPGLQARVVGVVLVALGLLALRLSLRHWRTVWLVRTTPQERIGSLSAGRVKLQGTVQAHEETITVPQFDEEFVYVEDGYELRHARHEDGSAPRIAGARTQQEPGDGAQTVAFELADETGRVLVRADENATVEVVDPDASRRLVELFDRSKEPPRSSRYNRQGVLVLPVGTEVSVFGRAVPGADAEIEDGQADLLEVCHDPETDRFQVVTLPETDFAGRYAGQWLVATALGLLLSAVGAYVFLQGPGLTLPLPH